MRLRSSVRWATSDIVAAASRGGRGAAPRPRPAAHRRPAWVRVGQRGPSAARVCSARARSSAARASATRASSCSWAVRSPSADVAGVAGRRSRRGPAWSRAASLLADVVVLHALHLALEDAQRAAERARGVGQLLVAEEQQDRQDDQADLQRAESVHDGPPGVGGTGDATPEGCPPSPRWRGGAPLVQPVVRAARDALAVVCLRPGPAAGATSRSKRRRPRGASRPRAPEHAVGQRRRGRRAASTTTTIHTTSSSTGATLAGGRVGGLDAVAGQRRPGVGGDLRRRGSAGSSTTPSPPREATSRRAQARSCGAHRDGEPAGRVVDGGDGVDRVVVGDPAGAAGQPQPDRRASRARAGRRRRRRRARGPAAAARPARRGRRRRRPGPAGTAARPRPGGTRPPGTSGRRPAAAASGRPCARCARRGWARSSAGAGRACAPAPPGRRRAPPRGRPR